MVIPLHDDNRTGRRAIVVLALIAINVFVFAFVQPHDDARAEIRFNYEHAAIPCELDQRSPLSFTEAKTAECDAVGSAEIFPSKNVFLSILVSMFLHGSWLHLLGNLLFLWVFGNNVEDRLGPIGFAVFYLFAGAAATIGHAAVDAGSTVPVIGASGAIAGVMGAYLVFWPRARIHSLAFFVVIPLPAAVVLGIWFVLQFGTDPNSGVAWVAHVTGFGIGVLVALILRAAGGPLRSVAWPNPPPDPPASFGGRRY
ncbi:MAG TPA: rhomboid family intramembrane serine protease [Acidimicrobiia bacterium]|nr:rhomboid family intramembrane serine protease [Acidimicrobiia bacterium]